LLVVIVSAANLFEQQQQIFVSDLLFFLIFAKQRLWLLSDGMHINQA
jgi:hypothetical protein